MHYGNYRKASHFLYSLLNKKGKYKYKKLKKNKIKYIINKKQLKKEEEETFY